MGSKRVRFDLGTGGGDGSPHRPPPPAPRARRTLLSMDVDADNDSRLVAGEAAACAAVRHDADAGPIRGVDPALAAATRAAARRGEASDLHTAEEPGPAPDVAAAASASGVPLVPFNMDDERSIGFFDASGTFVFYAPRRERDAWLESLPRGPSGDGGAPSSSDDESSDDGDGGPSDAPQELSGAVKRALSLRLARLLRPEENVLAALRRLGGLGLRARRAAHAHTGRPPPLPRGRTVPAEHRAEFDELTDVSARLLAAGDVSAHVAPREALLARVGAASGGGVVGGGRGAGGSTDATYPPAAAAADPAAAGAPPAAAAGPPAPRAAVQPPSPAAPPPPPPAGLEGTDFRPAGGEGLWYSSSRGVWFDAGSGAVGCAATGAWAAGSAADARAAGGGGSEATGEVVQS